MDFQSGEQIKKIPFCFFKYSIHLHITGRERGRGRGRRAFLTSRTNNSGRQHREPEIREKFISMDDCEIEAIVRPNRDYHNLDSRHTTGRPSPFLAYDKKFDFFKIYSVEPMHTVFHGAVKGLFTHALFNSQFHRSMIAGKIYFNTYLQEIIL